MPLRSNVISGGPSSEVGKPKVIVKTISGEAARFFAKYHVSGANLGLWIDQGDSQSGTSVATWDDLSGREVSGQDNDIVQATASYQPTVTGAFPGYRTFDGSDNYMHQKIYDTEQGNMTFVADGGTAEFRDDGQDFSDWETTSGSAAYMIVITTDNGVSWAYMGASNNSGQDIDCYSDIALTTRGWKERTTPQASPDTPASYEVRKTNFQITGALTVLAWVKNPDVTDYCITKDDYGFTAQRTYALYYEGSGYAQVFISNDGVALKSKANNVDISDDAWHQIGGTFIPSTSVNIYVDGVFRGANTNTIPATIVDSYVKFTIGGTFNSGTIAFPWNGEVASVMVFSRALSGDEILRIYQSDYARFK